MPVARHWESTERKLGCFPFPPSFPSCPNPNATEQFAQRSVLLQQSQGRNQTPSHIDPAPETHRSHLGTAKMARPDLRGALGVMNPPASAVLRLPMPEAVPAAQASM